MGTSSWDIPIINYRELTTKTQLKNKLTRTITAHDTTPLK